MISEPYLKGPRINSLIFILSLIFISCHCDCPIARYRGEFKLGIFYINELGQAKVVQTQSVANQLTAQNFSFILDAPLLKSNPLIFIGIFYHDSRADRFFLYFSQQLRKLLDCWRQGSIFGIFKFYTFFKRLSRIEQNLELQIFSYLEEVFHHWWRNLQEQRRYKHCIKENWRKWFEFW